jgi:diguanylate cyclase (GGDEF)-like protein
MLVDDSQDFLDGNRMLLEREGHRVLVASNGPDALSMLRANKLDLLLIDYFMPGMTGEEVVQELRTFDRQLQVILQTGFAGERPPRDTLRRLDIQGYHDKSEGPDKLLLWVEVGLKAAYAVQLLNKSRKGLQYILEATPDLHKICPLEDLLQGILWQFAGLLNIVDSFLATTNIESGVTDLDSDSHAFVAVSEGEIDLSVRAATGAFRTGTGVSAELSEARRAVVQQAHRTGEMATGDGVTAVPLRVGSATEGVIFLDRSLITAEDIDLVKVFANQAASALRNAQLFQMATLDRLTGTLVRRFFEQVYAREVRVGYRAGHPVSLLMVDGDRFKTINDTRGHIAGDRALALIGKDLRTAIRTTDFVGRFGGDEFCVLLPFTPAQGAEVVAARFLSLLEQSACSESLPLSCSVGIATLAPPTISGPGKFRVTNEYFQRSEKALLSAADKAMYEAKQAGGNQVRSAACLNWPAIDEPPDGHGTSAPA